MNKFLLIIVLLLSIHNNSSAQTNNELWNGKKCAVVLTYDDALWSHLDNVIPVLDKLDLKATFYISVYAEACKTRINDWKKVAQNGHELGNHTLFHPCLGGKGREWVTPEYDMNLYNVARMEEEIRMTNVFLNLVDNKTHRTFAYTCGDMKIGDSLFINGLKKDVAAARAVRNQMHQLHEVNLYDIDCYGVVKETSEQMIEWVNEAEAKGALLVILFHGVGGGHPSLDISVEEHNKFVEYLHQKRNDIWIAPLIDVVDYIKTKQK